MGIRYDREVDAAYIRLKQSVGVGGVKTTLPVDDDINLDFDFEHRLVGIEILAASKRLPGELLDRAE
jgi:uncharacterized protein YuzE